MQTDTLPQAKPSTTNPPKHSTHLDDWGGLRQTRGLNHDAVKLVPPLVLQCRQAARWERPRLGSKI